MGKRLRKLLATLRAGNDCKLLRKRNEIVRCTHLIYIFHAGYDNQRITSNEFALFEEEEVYCASSVLTRLLLGEEQIIIQENEGESGPVGMNTFYEIINEIYRCQGLS